MRKMLVAEHKQMLDSIKVPHTDESPLACFEAEELRVAAAEQATMDGIDDVKARVSVIEEKVMSSLGAISGLKKDLDALPTILKLLSRPDAKEKAVKPVMGEPR